MKNGQIVSADEAREIIKTFGVVAVIDGGTEIKDFSIGDIEDEDSFTINANFPWYAFLALQESDLGISIGTSGEWADNEWTLDI